MKRFLLWPALGVSQSREAGVEEKARTGGEAVVGRSGRRRTIKVSGEPGGL